MRPRDSRGPGLVFLTSYFSSSTTNILSTLNFQVLYTAVSCMHYIT